VSDALPTLVAPSPTDPARADAPGGFTWWYADLVDGDGNGAVAIFALGLPFLPGYASAARAGSAPPARQRPSVFFTAVRGGRPWFWALHETDPADVVWEADRVRFGASTLEVRLDGGRAQWTAELAGALPGCPWRAQVEVEGPLRRATRGEPAAAPHEWTVLSAVARGRASIRAGGDALRIDGRAYLDRNTGDRWLDGLDGLDVADWTWGRVALPGRERVWYVATSRDGAVHARALTVEADGRSSVAPGGAEVVGWRHTAWGLRVPTAVTVRGDDPALTVTLRAPIDDSPFYARFLVEAEEAGERGRGFAEVCRPDRIDAAWFRPLLRMTVCSDHRPRDNSVWLPLFGGTRAGRLQRLVGWQP
jgi:carotenoid 1,2-hydratase